MTPPLRNMYLKEIGAEQQTSEEREAKVRSYVASSDEIQSRISVAHILASQVRLLIQWGATGHRSTISVIQDRGHLGIPVSVTSYTFILFIPYDRYR